MKAFTGINENETYVGEGKDVNVLKLELVSVQFAEMAILQKFEYRLWTVERLRGLCIFGTLSNFVNFFEVSFQYYLFIVLMLISG